MMVHSFCAEATGLGDYLAFFERLGVSGAGRDRLGSPIRAGGVTLWTGWASNGCTES